MKNHFLWALTLALIALFTFQDALADYCTYSGNMSSSRKLNSFTLTDGTNSLTVSSIQTSTTDAVYKDKTSSVLSTTAGSTLRFSALDATEYTWLHIYVYIDYGNNQTFNTTANNTGTVTNDEENEVYGDLVSYSCYDVNNDASNQSWKNILGETVSNSGNATTSGVPSWTLPADLAAGTYRLRLKSDWSSIDPCGTTKYNNADNHTPTALGGCICDITIKIIAKERTISVKQNYDQAGTVTGGTTASGDITITATANSGYEFVNWTLEGEEVSTSATYTDITDGDKTYTANFRKVLDRSGWEITVDGEGYDSTNSSSSVEGPKSNMIDGLTNTFWHSYYSGQSSSWGNENLPHYVQFNLGSIQEFDKFKYVSRNASTSQNGNIVNYQLYVSDSDMTSSLGNGSIPTNGTLISSGAFTYDGSSAEHMVDLGQLYSGQYIFFLATSENGSQNKFANCAEFYLYQYNFDVTINVEAGEGGSAEITEGGSGTSATVSSGASVTLTATPADGYGFVNWTNSGGTVVSPDATYTFTATTNDTYTANFAEKIVVTIASNDDAMGTVRFSEGEGTTKELGSGASVTIIAEPISTAYKFVQWEDGTTAATRTIENITESATYTATFAAKQIYTVTVTTPEVAGGDVTYTVNGEGVTESTVIYEGDELVFTASENRGYKFVEWSDGVNQLSANTEYTTTATANMTIVPVYASLKAFTFEVEQPQGATISVVDREGNDISDATVYERDVITISIAVDAIYKLNGLYVNGNQQGLDANNTVIYTLTDAIESPITITAQTARLTQDEMYEAMAKPTFTKLGNLMNTQGVEIMSGAQNIIPGTIDLSGLDYVTDGNQKDAEGNMVKVPTGATSPIYVSPGANFDLKLTLYTNAWGGMQFFQYHNAFNNETASYGYYGTYGAHNAAKFWEDASADAEIAVDQENSTITINVSLSENVNVGDIVVFRAMSANSGASIDADGTYSEGTYLDILFYVVDPEVSVAINPAEGGAVTTSPSEINIGTEVTLTAAPADGYTFVNWIDANGEEAGTGLTYTFSATKENNYTAIFTPYTKIALSATAGEEVIVSVVTDADCTIKVNDTEIEVTADTSTEITATVSESGNLEIEAIGANITSIDCGENTVPTELPTTITELALRNVDAGEVEIDAPALEKITVVSEAPAHEATGEDYDYKVATVVPTSDLSQGVQVVVEKEINTPQPLQDKGTPSYFNFLSMPFAFNTADIKYWDGDSWEPATAETQVRIMTYNSEIRAQGRYGETWEKVESGASIDIAANQGFVIVGNNNYGSDYKMQLQFTSAESAYIQDGRVKSVETVENNNGGTSHIFDENWNHIGAPYLTKVTAPEGKTIYTHTGYNYEQYVPADDPKTINPYQGFMLQSVGSISLEAETAVAALSLTKASESVYAKAYISVDDCAPAKIILSDESSENFVLNEDAWYMAPTANVISSNYFIVDGMEASVTVQPEASDLPMTVYAGAGTSHTISLTRIEGERNVYLKDALTDEIICLNEEDYTFTSSAKTTIANRFTISMTEPTGIIESAISEGTIKVVVSGDNIKMYGTVEGTDITLYNANGMVITNAVAEEGVTTVSTSATGVIVIKADNTVVKVVK